MKMKIGMYEKRASRILDVKICMCKLLHHEALVGKFIFHKVPL